MLIFSKIKMFIVAFFGAVFAGLLLLFKIEKNKNKKLSSELEKEKKDKDNVIKVNQENIEVEERVKKAEQKVEEIGKKLDEIENKVYKTKVEIESTTIQDIVETIDAPQGKDNENKEGKIAVKSKKKKVTFGKANWFIFIPFIIGMSMINVSCTKYVDRIVYKKIYVMESIPELKKLERPTEKQVELYNYDIEGKEMYCGTDEDILNLYKNQENYRAVIKGYESIIDNYTAFYLDYNNRKAQLESSKQ